jgi:hypothetical protein
MSSLLIFGFIFFLNKYTNSCKIENKNVDTFIIKKHKDIILNYNNRFKKKYNYKIKNQKEFNKIKYIFGLKKEYKNISYKNAINLYNKFYLQYINKK